MNSERNSDSNLDEDILQCREEIFRIQRREQSSAEDSEESKKQEKQGLRSGESVILADNNESIRRLQEQLELQNHQQSEILKDKNQDIDLLLHQNALFREKITTLEKIRDQLQARLSAMETELTEVLSQFEQFRTRREQFDQSKTERSAIQEEFSRIQARAEVLEQTLEQKTDQLQDAADEKNKLIEQIHQLQEQNQIKSEMCDRLKREIEEYKQMPQAMDEEESSELFESVESPFSERNHKPAETALRPEIPEFSLAEHILSAHRGQASARRKKPDRAGAGQTDSVRRIVENYVAAPPESAEAGLMPDSQAWQGDAFEDSFKEVSEADDIIRQIVRRDIEAFCRQKGNIRIEFPDAIL